MRVLAGVWSIRAGCVAAACAALLLPATTMTAQQSAAPPASPPAPAQAPAQPAGPPPNPNAAATAADHRDMMAQLGITALRPGPSGNESAPNHANYDEALANPYPKLPGGPDARERPQGHERGRVVEAAAAGDRRGVRSRSARTRAEGRAEGHVGRRTAPRTSRSADAPVVGKELIGKVDNASHPDDHRRHSDDGRHAGRGDQARAGDDDVRRAIRDAPAPWRAAAGRRAVSARAGRSRRIRRRRPIRPRPSSSSPTAGATRPSAPAASRRTTAPG